MTVTTCSNMWYNGYLNNRQYITIINITIVILTPGRSHRGLSLGKGSCSVTSSIAPPNHPFL